MGVVKVATELAVYHGADINKVKIAALLHDVTKLESPDVTNTIIEREWGKDILKEYPQPIRHALTAVVFAKEICKITDQEILDAIMNHATGGPGMKTLEKIIFVADYIEPSRLHVSETLRTMARLDLDRAVMMVAMKESSYLEASGYSIASKMLALLAEMKKKKDVDE